jgi:hypothetical protein
VGPGAGGVVGGSPGATGDTAAQHLTDSARRTAAMWRGKAARLALGAAAVAAPVSAAVAAAVVGVVAIVARGCCLGGGGGGLGDAQREDVGLSFARTREMCGSDGTGVEIWGGTAVSHCRTRLTLIGGSQMYWTHASVCTTFMNVSASVHERVHQFWTGCGCRVPTVLTCRPEPFPGQVGIKNHRGSDCSYSGPRSFLKGKKGLYHRGSD